MKALWTEAHEEYRLKNDLSDGYPPFEHMERPERVASIMRAVKRLGFELIDATPGPGNGQGHEPELLRTLHDPEYVELLKKVCHELAEAEELVPGVFHPREHTGLVPPRQRIGSFTNELGTPLTRRSYEAALASFSLALAGAEELLNSGEDTLCLTRPPGHHAGRARYGGYCLFNNAAGAAHLLSQSCGEKVAILDIDYHIGDGTLEFASQKTPYYSLHADPATSYPHRAFSDDDNDHATLVPLAPGNGSFEYLHALTWLVERINFLGPAYVVVSAGFDTLGEDYIQDAPLNLAAADFTVVGKLVRGIDAPKLYLLEGGYDPEQLEQCAFNFFSK